MAMNTKLRLQEWDIAVAGLLSVASLSLYVRTLAPSVATLFDDSLEFQLVCPTLGITHPTGYPLYTLLGWLFSRLPVGDAAYRVNLMSACFGALTIALLYLIVTVITGRRGAALISAISFGVSPVFWSQATIAEVYTLHTTLMAAVVYFLLKWQAEGKSSSLAFAIVVYGLSLAHHRMTVLLLPAILVFLWLNRAKMPRRARDYLKLAFLLGLPLLLYLYIPLRGLNTTSLDGTYQNTWSGFWHWVAASGYGVFFGQNPLAKARSLDFYGRLWLQQFGPVGIALALLGLGGLWRQDRQNRLILTMAFLITAAFAVLYRAPDVEVFALPALLFFATFIGTGADLLFSALPSFFTCGALERGCVIDTRIAHRLFRIPSSRLPFHALRFTFCLLLFIQPLLILTTNFSAQDRSHNWSIYDYGRDILAQPLEGRAVIIGILGEMTLLRYFQQTEGLRPEVETVAADQEVARWQALETALASDRPVYLTRDLAGIAERYSLSALGPLIRVYQSPQAVIPKMAHWVKAELSPGLNLVGYDTVWLPYHQPTLRLNLVWQVTGRIKNDLKVSARLLAPNDVLAAQTDAMPVHNVYPTSRWRPGEVVFDVYDLVLESTGEPGPYRVLVLVYDPATLAEIGRVELEPVEWK